MYTDSILDAVSAEDSAEILLRAGAALATPRKNPDADGAAYTIVPDGHQLQTLPVVDRPKRPTGLVHLRDAKSFTSFWLTQSGPASRIYATLEPAKFVAVFDDTPAYCSNVEYTRFTDWRQHRADFVVPASREWKIWTEANKKHMSQLQFAEFLLDNMPDVIEPDGASLYQLSLNFEATQSGKFVATQRLQDGSHDLQWRADNSGGTVKLPEHITINIPVFENEAAVQMSARLRYRCKDGDLKLWYELVRPHKVLEASFREVWTRIETGCKTSILLGTPE